MYCLSTPFDASLTTILPMKTVLDSIYHDNYQCCNWIEIGIIVICLYHYKWTKSSIDIHMLHIHKRVELKSIAKNTLHSYTIF